MLRDEAFNLISTFKQQFRQMLEDELEEFHYRMDRHIERINGNERKPLAIKSGRGKCPNKPFIKLGLKNEDGSKKEKESVSLPTLQRDDNIEISMEEYALDIVETISPQIEKVKDEIVDLQSEEDESFQLMTSLEEESQVDDHVVQLQTLQVHVEEDGDAIHKDNNVSTECHEGESCSSVVDGVSCNDVTSNSLMENLSFSNLDCSRPYELQWFKIHGEVKVHRQVLVSFSTGKYMDQVLCEVIPSVLASHIDKPWMFGRGGKSCIDGQTNKVFGSISNPHFSLTNSIDSFLQQDGDHLFSKELTTAFKITKGIDHQRNFLSAPFDVIQDSRTNPFEEGEYDTILTSSKMKNWRNRKRMSLMKLCAFKILIISPKDMVEESMVKNWKTRKREFVRQVVFMHSNFSILNFVGIILISSN